MTFIFLEFCRTFATFLVKNKIKNCMGLYLGKLTNGGELYRAFYGFACVMLSVVKREELHKVAALNLSNVNAEVRK